MNVMKEYHEPHENLLFNYREKDGKGYTYCPHCKKFVEMDLHYKDNYSRYNYVVPSNSIKLSDPVVVNTENEEVVTVEKTVTLKPVENKAEQKELVCTTPVGKYNIEFLYATCPECKNTFTKDDYRVQTLDRDYNATDYTPLNHVYVVRDTSKSGKKLLTVICLLTRHTCWNKKMQFEKVAYKIIFNLETGMTYATSMYYLKNKKPVFKGQQQYYNITYTPCLMLPFSNKAAHVVREALFEAKKEFCPYAKEPRDKADISELALFNRLPSIEARIMIGNLDARCGRSGIYREIRTIKSNTTDFYGDVFKLLKVKPNKTLRRYLISGGSYTSLKVMLKAFKQIDSIAKLNAYDFDKAHLPFLKAMINVYGETNTVNKILDISSSSNAFLFGGTVNNSDRLSPGYDFTDSAHMWKKIKSYGEEYVFPKKSTLREIHDDLSVQERKLRKKNKELKYSEEEIKRFHKETERFSLRFAKNTHELIEVGSSMGICVGSYDDRAYERYCDILLVTDKTNGYYVCCIERKEDYLEQIKACGNKVPEGELYEFINEWIDEIKINAGYDWRRAKEFYESKTTQYVHDGQKGAYFANIEIPTQEEYDKQRRIARTTPVNWDVQVNHIQVV